jgi:hypothetical protein
MDNSTKGNMSRLVSFLENFNPEMADKNTISELSNTSNLIQLDPSGDNMLLKELRQNHTKFAVFDKPPQVNEKISYKSSIDLNKMDNLVESQIWKNGPNTNSLFDAYENKKNNLVRNEDLATNFQRGKKFKPLEDDEPEERMQRPKKTQGSGFYMENNNLKRKK